LLRVYNRWGEKIFDASPLLNDREQHGWDGFFAMSMAKWYLSLLYRYSVYWQFTDGNEEQVTGDLLLVQ